MARRLFISLGLVLAALAFPAAASAGVGQEAPYFGSEAAREAMNQHMGAGGRAERHMHAALGGRFHDGGGMSDGPIIAIGALLIAGAALGGIWFGRRTHGSPPLRGSGP